MIGPYYYYLQTEVPDISEIYNYLADPQSFVQNPPKIQFQIYQKLFLECGFPKKHGEMTCEEARRNGTCSLELMLKNNKFQDHVNWFGINNPTGRQRFNLVYKQREQFWGALNRISTEAWNTGLAITQDFLSKLFSMNTFMSIINKLLPELLEFLPTDCLQVICEASRKMQDKSKIAGMSDRIGNAMETTGFLLKEMR